MNFPTGVTPQEMRAQSRPCRESWSADPADLWERAGGKFVIYILPDGDVVVAARYPAVLAENEDTRRAAIPFDAVEPFALG